MIKNYDLFSGQFIGVNCDSFVGPFIVAVLYTGKNKKEIDNFIRKITNPRKCCCKLTVATSNNMLINICCFNECIYEPQLNTYYVDKLAKYKVGFYNQDDEIIFTPCKLS